MKRWLPILFALLLLILFALAALRYLAPENSSSYADGLYYTNLNSDRDLELFENILEEGGIPEEDGEDLVILIRQYNQQFSSILKAKDHPLKTDSLIIPYDEARAFQIWFDKTSNRYSDVNCRIAAFSIMKSRINATQPYKGNSLNLMFDYSCLDQYPVESFSQEEREQFTALYAVMTPPSTEDKGAMADFIRGEWETRGVTFAEGSPSLVNVFLHDVGLQELFVGHCGVLMELSDKQYAFFEKLAPTLPYQLSFFQNKEELVAYLEGKYGSRYEAGGVRPLIMENLQLLNP